MRIGITGASGMLGKALVSHLSATNSVFATSKHKVDVHKNTVWHHFDLIDADSLNQWLQEVKPDIVIHCAAITNVELCEKEVDIATGVHIESTRIIANHQSIHGGRLIYISTDSVFDGNSANPYRETDATNPLNVYAKTKLEGEKFVQAMSNGLVLRTNIIGHTEPGRVSFAEWLLEGLIEKKPLNLFYDVYFSPLHVNDLSAIIGKIIEEPIVGLYHCASRDSISKYDFGKKMAELFELSDSNINRVSVDNMGFKADRPKNMALNIDKISRSLSYQMPNAIDAILTMKQNMSQ